jgi:hypothetical protein
VRRFLPRSRGARVALALIIANELRGVIMAGPPLFAIIHHWF